MLNTYLEGGEERDIATAISDSSPQMPTSAETGLSWSQEPGTQSGSQALTCHLLPATVCISRKLALEVSRNLGTALWAWGFPLQGCNHFPNVCSVWLLFIKVTGLLGGVVNSESWCRCTTSQISQSSSSVFCLTVVETVKLKSGHHQESLPLEDLGEESCLPVGSAPASAACWSSSASLAALFLPLPVLLCVSLQISSSWKG